MVVDVRPDDWIPERDAEAFAVTALACELAGWEFRRVGELDPVLTTNVRWLSRHRHARCLVPEIAEALLVVFAETDPPSPVSVACFVVRGNRSGVVWPAWLGSSRWVADPRTKGKDLGKGTNHKEGEG